MGRSSGASRGGGPLRALVSFFFFLLHGLALLSPVARAQEVMLVEARYPMRFLANSADPGIDGMTWADRTYDDSAWTAGVYGVGYENAQGAENLIDTPVPVGTLSIYTRTYFTVTNKANVHSLHLGVDYDDGYVVWINGVEVFRSPEMPSTALLWNSIPESHESSNGQQANYAPFHDLSSAIPYLEQGTNVMAAAVWNRNANSDDLVLVPQLAGNKAFGLLRGPYLQSGSDTSVRVRWRTEQPTSSRVVYGSSPTNLTLTQQVFESVTEHEVLLRNLIPNTRYYYAIGNLQELLVGADDQHFFVTAPPTGVNKPTRIWVLGDSGTGGAGPVRKAYEAFTGTRHTDLWLMLGDNAYPHGTDVEYQVRLFNIFRNMLRRSVLWPTIGNHDCDSAASIFEFGPYYDNFSLPENGEAGGVASGTEAYYSFDYGPIHFVVLNSHDIDRSPPPQGVMLTWLENDLAATTQDWIIAFFHHPPYSDGSHKSDTELQMVEMRENAVPILEDYGVDLVLTGHSHSYERTFLLDGYYGDSSDFGPAYVVDGGSGRADTPDGPYLKPSIGAEPHEGAVYAVSGTAGIIYPATLQFPAMYTSFATLGSLVLDLDGTRLDVKFLAASGALLDYFTIVKGPYCPDEPDADGDGVCDGADNCPSVSNPLQQDDDEDDIGSACDLCPHDPQDDVDHDGICGDLDNCPAIANQAQLDTDTDGLGNVCDPCPGDPQNDPDADGVCWNADNCPTVSNAAQTDTDEDDAGDACDVCPFDALDDAEQDGFCADVDNCPASANSAQADADVDGAGDFCDPCALDAANDADLDGACGNVDVCPGTSDPAQADTDGDGIGDACDACALDPENDFDGDAICEPADNCPGAPNVDQLDFDRDDIGDACDLPGDADGDSVGDATDNCPGGPNPAQADANSDGVGDACDDDDDGDGWPDAFDCAPLAPGVSEPPAPIGPSLKLGKAAGTTLYWIHNAQGHLTDVYRGTSPQLFDCVDFENPNTWSVQGETPPPGGIFFYVLAPVNACGESDSGFPRGIDCPPSQGDSDGDGIVDLEDSCPLAFDPDLSDLDGDFVGDPCDNCPLVPNANQLDSDSDGTGDACE